MAKANPFRFSTKYQDDETDFLYYGYRYYDASTGRWLSRDPLGERGGKSLFCFIQNGALTRTDFLGLELQPDPGIYLPKCKFSVTFELIPSSEFQGLQKLNQVGVTWVNNSADMQKELERLVPKYDPDGNCCRGSCVKQLVISSHSAGTGSVTLSSDRSEQYNPDDLQKLEKIVAHGQQLSPDLQQVYDINKAGQSFLEKVKGKLCRDATVVIVQCQAEYPPGSGGNLKESLESLFDNGVRVQTFSGNCGLRTPLWPLPAIPVELE